MAALTGDDEIELLLSQMGGGGAAIAAAAAPAAETTTTKKEKNKERPHKSKKKKKKRKRDASEKVNEVSTSFADSRLTQNPFEWPCCRQSGERRLMLGSGLAHECSGYTCDEETKYGSNSCQSCGEAAATHELYISASDLKKDQDEDDPFSAISIASIITSSRNARCLMAEYYPNESQKQQRHLSPPMNSTSSSLKLITSKLDSNVGKVLSRVKKMENNRANQQLISSSDVDLLREKVSELVKTTLAYKEAIKAACLSNANSKAAGIALIESRLTALAACDEVYYRCYYASFFFDSAHQADLTLLVPHPPTYFTCPGLAWDSKDAGAASLRMFLGEMEHSEQSSSSLAAPLDAATRELILNSWCLQERLSTSKADTEQSNPLLALWQSRFLESIRHLWTSKYTFIKSPIALKAALNKKHCDDHSDPLIRHETYGLSPAAEAWRGSIRDYPANFYAYAVPTRQALESVLEVLHNQESVVEAGAGTGYLSAVLASHLKKNGAGSVFPYDITPPRQANAGVEVTSNEYHGQVPTFIDVHQAQSFEQSQSILPSTSVKASLLLCYPPPASDMAAIALSQYIASGGDTVIHVGEWQGMTGDKTFESMLHGNFHCEEKGVVQLPLWGTDATYLTIWRKKSSNTEGSRSFSPAIGYCSASHCSNNAIRRCRFARCLQYCGAECFRQHATVRRAILALHMIHLSNYELDFENVNHFVPLSWVTDHLPAHGGQPRKKRKKKKHSK